MTTIESRPAAVERQLRFQRIVIAGLLIGCFSALPNADAAAQSRTPEEIMRSARNNLSHEMTICAAYYMVAAEAMRRSGKRDAVERLEQASDRLLDRSREINPEKTVLARLELGVRDMAAEIDHNMENIAILIAKYADPCKLITEHPEVRLNQLAATMLYEQGIITAQERDQMTKGR